MSTSKFETTIKRVGEVRGGRRVPGTGEKIPFHNSLLNTVEKNTPVFVGMGNEIKLYLVFWFRDNVIETLNMWVNLCWIQRAKMPPEENGVVYDAPAGSAGDLIRVLDENARLTGGNAFSSLNHGAFYDANFETRSFADGVEDIEVRYQRIKLPLSRFVNYPFNPFIMPLGPIPASRPLRQGIVYECEAKADELFLVVQADSETFSGTKDDFISADVAIESAPQPVSSCSPALGGNGRRGALKGLIKRIGKLPRRKDR